MELSRKVATRVWFELLWLLILAFLPFIVSYIVLEVKLAWTLYPTIHDVINSSNPDVGRFLKVVMETARNSLVLVFLNKLVLLLNLPFALGALMYAYENIFGTRPTPST